MVDPVEAWQVRCACRHARGDHVRRRLQRLLVHLEGPLVDEASVSVSDREAVRVRDVDVLGGDEVVDELLLLLDQAGQVDIAG